MARSSSAPSESLFNVDRESGTLTIYPGNGILPQDYSRAAEHAKEGIISSLHLEKNLGFLIASEPLPLGFKNEDGGTSVFFYFNKISNRRDRSVDLRVGSKVKFVLNLKVRDKPKALYLLVEDDEEPENVVDHFRRERCQRPSTSLEGMDKNVKYSKQKSASSNALPTVASSVRENKERKATAVKKLASAQPAHEPLIRKPLYQPGPMSGTLEVFAKTAYPPGLFPFKDKLISGVIRHLHVDKEFGFIKPSSTDNSDVFFYFNKLKNLSEDDVILGPGSLVRFAADGKTDDKKVKVALIEITGDSSGRKQVALKCGHSVQKDYHEREEELVCQTKCRKLLRCGLQHFCDEICGLVHDHTACQRMVKYRFPYCGHGSPKRKKCSEVITWKCKADTMVESAPCGHSFKKKCHEASVCPLPCQKNLKCGHTCLLKCGQPCSAKDCKICMDLADSAEKDAKANMEKKIKEMKEVLAKKGSKGRFKVETLSKRGDSSAEFQKVEDQVTKFIEPCHKWVPVITKIEKVTNLDLEERFEQARITAFDDFWDYKFHGTSQAAIDSIIREGFRMPTKTGMYGKGLYFATNSSKSAQTTYTKGSEKLLMCKVLLGKSLVVCKDDNSISSESLRKEGYDSVYAPRGTKSTGGVMNDEFVVFKAEYALPSYIIHYSSNGLAPQNVLMQHSTSPAQRFLKKNMKASRDIDTDDPFENSYRLAEWHFLRMVKRHQASPFGSPLNDPKIESIDIVINKDLEEKFEAQAKAFEKSKAPYKPVFAYHGTDVGNIDSILQNNLNVSYAKRQAYGSGNYFSEFPDISLGYGKGLLLCKILLGNEYVDSTSKAIPSGYHSKKVNPDVAMDGCGQMLIVANPDQILPSYVIHLKK